jgi:tRNA 2-selenouridine synthase
MKSTPIAPLDRLPEFDTIIDVRSPSEFAEDHIPGAINCPVLDDDQRAEVGTLYKQVSPFDARRLGAALISANIARHLQVHFLDRPKNWHPLIYCWRGGMRSGAMTHVFRQVGWNAQQLDGGYKTYRRHVVDRLAELPRAFRFRVIAGATGSAKSRVLQALGSLGAQILDLEALACHKGSVLGVLPDRPQPTQKAFESMLLREFETLDPRRLVHVEAESRKIGHLQVPEALIETMRGSACVTIEATLDARVDFLLGDYDYFIANVDWLVQRLETLRELRGKEAVGRWVALARAGAWREFVHDILLDHYDPLYQRSQDRNYVGFGAPQAFASDDLSPAGIAALASRILALGDVVETATA